MSPKPFVESPEGSSPCADRRGDAPPARVSFPDGLADRVAFKAHKIWVGTVTGLRLRAVAKGKRYRRLASRGWRSTYAGGGRILNVYARPSDVLDVISAVDVALKPVEILNDCVFVYPEIRTGARESVDEVFACIDSYAAATDVRSVAALTAPYPRPEFPALPFLHDYVARACDPARPIPVGLCHGDLTRWNMGRQAERLVIFDWDEHFRYVPTYDKIYFLLMEHLIETGRFSYWGAYEHLGVSGTRFRLSTALERLDQCCGGRFERLDLLLFLLAFLGRSVGTGWRTRALWRRVRVISE